MDDLEQHLIELEIRLALQDELVSSLNDTIVKMQRTLDLQQGQLQWLYQHLQQDDRLGQGKLYSLADEVPPHY